MAYPPEEYRNEKETCEHFLHITFEGETPKKLPVLRCAAFTGICLFITHEIDAALYLADEIHVMQNGKLIEGCQWNGNLDVFQNPYTVFVNKKVLQKGSKKESTFNTQ